MAFLYGVFFLFACLSGASLPNLHISRRAAPRAARRRAPRGFRAVPMKDYYLPGVHAEELLVAADFGDALRVKALVEKGAATLPHQLPCALVPRSPFA
jgi:hypothetical protein